MLPLLLAAVVFAVLALILRPLLRGAGAAVDASVFDQAVYRDQLRELERDIARGVLRESDAAGARLEIQRRLLAAAGRTDGAATPAGRRPWAAVIVGLTVIIGSIGVYLTLGAPGVPDMPIAARTPAQGGGDQGEQMARALTQLRARVTAEPANADAWLQLARAAAGVDDWDGAAEAYKRAVDLGRNDVDILSGYAEMLVLRARGVVTPTARAVFAQVLAADPKDGAARYYTALAAGQDGEGARAIAEFQALLADLPADSPMRGEISARIAEAAKMAGLPVPPPPPGRSAEPDTAAVEGAAGMTPAERQAMIDGMVGRLAARMATTPDDLDGWMKLGRAYAVLGEMDKAADAYDRAAALKPGDADILLTAAQSLLSGVRPIDPLPPRTVALLRRIEAVAPGRPAVLWYLGLTAAREGHPDAARAFWRRLLQALPADSDEARTVKAALEALRGG